jgi:hypothetical protein
MERASTWSPRFEEIEVWLWNSEHHLFAAEVQEGIPQLCGFDEIVECLTLLPSNSSCRIIWADAVLTFNGQEFLGWLRERPQSRKEECLTVRLWQAVKAVSEENDGKSGDVAPEGCGMPPGLHVEKVLNRGASEAEDISQIFNTKVEDLVKEFLHKQAQAREIAAAVLDVEGTQLCFSSSRPLVNVPIPQALVLILGGYSGISKQSMEQLHSTFGMYSLPLLEVSLAPTTQHMYACLAFLKMHEDAGKLKAALVDLREMGPEGYNQQKLAAEALWHRRWIGANVTAEEHSKENGPIIQNLKSAAAKHMDAISSSSISWKSNGQVSGNGNTMDEACIAAATPWNAGMHGKGRRHVAQAVKDLQRTDPHGNAEWWAYCDMHAGGLRDPCRHTLSFLQTFLADFQAGHRNKVPSKCIGAQGISAGPPPGLELHAEALSGASSSVSVAPLGSHMVGNLPSNTSGRGSAGKGGNVKIEEWQDIRHPVVQRQALQEQLSQPPRHVVLQNTSRVSHNEFLSDLQRAILQEAPHNGKSLIGLDQFAPPLHPGHVHTSPELPSYRDDSRSWTDERMWSSEASLERMRTTCDQAAPTRANRSYTPPGISGRIPQMPAGVGAHASQSNGGWGTEQQMPARHRNEQSIHPEPQSKENVTTVLRALNSMLDEMVATPAHARGASQHVPLADLNPERLQELQKLMAELSLARTPHPGYSIDEPRQLPGRSVWTTGALPNLLEAGTNSLPQAPVQDPFQPLRLPQPPMCSQQSEYIRSHDSTSCAMEQEIGPRHLPQQDTRMYPVSSHREPSAWLLPQPRFSSS